MFRRKILIDHRQIPDAGLTEFPVWLALVDPVSRSVSRGGQVVDSDGNGFYFMASDGKTCLACEIRSYDPTTGSVEGVVRVPEVSCWEDTVVYLCCGTLEKSEKNKTGSVWGLQTQEILRSGDAFHLGEREALTVEAWVEADVYRPEALQSIVRQWASPDSFGSFSAYDAGETDGYRSEAYFGAVFDGQYVYFSPQHYEDHTAHGIVLRYDTQSDFKDSGSYEAYDAGQTDGLSTRGYYGAVFDGRYVYFVPRQDEAGYHSRVLRFDTHGEFKDERSWMAYDVGEAHSQQGAAFDGRYIYFSPGYEGDPKKEDTYSGRVIRCDTQGDFKDESSWAVFDAEEVSGRATCFDGAGFDGRYIYFAPLLHGMVLQYDTRGDFQSSRNWRVFDAKEMNMVMCVGTVFDGRHMYFVPYGNGRVVRFDAQGDFEDAAMWESRDASRTQGLDTNGFDGGFFDGSYVYFVPFVGLPKHTDNSGKQRLTLHGNLLRYNPRKSFEDPEAWQAVDGSLVDGLWTVGYNGGAFDGRFFYMAPWRDATGAGGMHGRILRYDTVGTHGTFDLRYGDCGQNGGLCAAVRGPAFLVNTEQGVLSVASLRPLAPGRHHLVGVYDGRTVKLFVDGVLAAEQTGSGRLQENDVPVQVGSEEGGVGCFEGVTEEVRISRMAYGDGWIKTMYRNRMRPGEFVRIEEGV